MSRRTRRAFRDATAIGRGRCSAFNHGMTTDGMDGVIRDAHPHPEEPAPARPDPLLEAARPFGISYLFPYQRLVISNVLDTDPDRISRQIVVLPTGAGKTLCFQLPVRLLPGVTVVIFPLRSLMADQLRRAEVAGLDAVTLSGGQSRTRRNDIWHRIEGGETQIVLTNPETLSQRPVLDRLSDLDISHLVIDEAHCVSEWGETFRPAYLELGRVIGALAPRVTTAFTATASPQVLDAVRTLLFGDQGVHLIQATPDRPNIAYSVLQTPAKEFALRTLLGGGAEDTALRPPALVFCRSRKRVETVARTLGEAIGPDRVTAYHAGLDTQERRDIEKWFFSATDAVLVATCAYGMGVDKSDVRTVVHYDLPPSVEAYLQESGRAGRDGEPAAAIVLFGHDDVDRLEAVPTGSQRARYAQMLAYCRAPGCRRSFLMGALGAECESCFGCDGCVRADHGAGTFPLSFRRAMKTQIDVERRTRRAAADVLRFLRRNPRMLNAAQASRLLRGNPTGSDVWVPRRLPDSHVAGAGDRGANGAPLRRWLESEVLALVAALRSEGRIRTCRFRPWRGTLSVPKQLDSCGRARNC